MLIKLKDGLTDNILAKEVIIFHRGLFSFIIQMSSVTGQKGQKVTSLD